ncbi:F-box only protein 5-like isoform X2 [Biomphalaria glabrata]|nr:F-box only protein 5-like isoform X2 [Biomphalaria glabrata]XP_055871794.1 F-box only protein 5-like isoform X2 [Biomphalaria glabrata]XP_055871795.1 F-box only protein 5-like isoform X2 [Biomphalaria glabrata]XP_055871796.1 F-box only protein 5-like isoform X2 [Biomphalaria glabrata]
MEFDETQKLESWQDEKKMEKVESSTLPDTFIFSTPLLQRSRAKNNLGLTNSSIDSGFGSSSISAANTFFSPDDETKNAGLLKSDFSPVRELSGLQGRRLTFESSEIQDYFPSTDLTLSYSKLELLEGNIEDEKVEENFMESTSTHESTKEAFPKSMQCSSHSSSSLSSSETDLEFSLQEMSLDELSSPGSSGSRSSPSCMKQSASLDSLDIVPHSLDQSQQDHERDGDSPTHLGDSPRSRHSFQKYCHKRDVTLTSDLTSLHKKSWSKSLKKVIKHFLPPEPSRLIGRNTGVRKFDIIHHLSVNFPSIVQRIFQLLSPSDLMSVCKVSLNWEKSLNNDSKAFQRYNQYLLESTKQSYLKEKDKENSSVEKPLEENLQETLTGTRGLLTTLQSQAITLTESKTTGLSSCQTNYFLTCEDTLRRCPRCQNSALIKPAEDRATCLNEKCGYDFCTRCFSAFHHPKRCKPLCRLVSTAGVAGTRKSKKNLKRL